jgi:ketosteroid isomerase-like protein
MNERSQYQREVIAAEQQLAAAHFDLDLQTIDHLLHPEYMILQPGGWIEGKQETLASLRSGERSWVVAQSDQLEVRIIDRTAVVTGRWRGKGVNQGQPFDYAARFLSIWVREAGRWLNIAYSATPVQID